MHYKHREKLARATFGAPLDAELKWAYQHGSFIYDGGEGSASLCVLPIVPCPDRVPLIPIDYSSPSNWAYLIHFISRYRRHNLRATILRLFEQIDWDNYLFPLTLVTHAQTMQGVRLLNYFFNVSFTEPTWGLISFQSKKTIFNTVSGNHKLTQTAIMQDDDPCLRTPKRTLN